MLAELRSLTASPLTPNNPTLPPHCPQQQAATDYGSYLANEASPLHTTTLVDRCTQRLVDDWNYLRCNVRSVWFVA